MDGEAGLHVAIAPRQRRPRSAGWTIAATLAGLAACDAGATVIAPVIDVPIGDPEATALGLDEITLTVAHAGSDRDLVSQTFPRGAGLALSGVPFGDDLVMHMSGFIGDGPAIAYGRTCTVVVSPSGAPPTPHLFFSLDVKFASVAATPVARVGGLGITYQGAALLVGGTDVASKALVTDVERFDPLTGALSMYGTVQARDRAVHATLGSSPPRALVIGGIAAGEGAGFVEVLDGRTVERIDVAETARVDLTATTLTDGRVIVIGGNPPGQPPVGEIDEIAQRDAIEVRRLTAVLARPRSGHTATRLGDGVGAPVLIAGGVDDTGTPIDIAELFKPLSEELASPTTFKFTMSVPRHGHTAALLPDGSVLIIGGFDALGQPVRKLELFSVDAGFAPVADLPTDAGVVEFATTTLPDGRILLTGGRAAPGSRALDTAYILSVDQLNGRVDVVATDHMAMTRAGHQAVALCDGTIFISGGTDNAPDAERYNPPPAGRR